MVRRFFFLLEPRQVAAKHAVWEITLCVSSLLLLIGLFGVVDVISDLVDQQSDSGIFTLNTSPTESTSHGGGPWAENSKVSESESVVSLRTVVREMAQHEVLIAAITYTLLEACLPVLMLLGTLKERRWMLLPWLLLRGLQIFSHMVVCVLVLFLVMLISPLFVVFCFLAYGVAIGYNVYVWVAVLKLFGELQYPSPEPVQLYHCSPMYQTNV